MTMTKTKTITCPMSVMNRFMQKSLARRRNLKEEIACVCANHEDNLKHYVQYSQCDEVAHNAYVTPNLANSGVMIEKLQQQLKSCIGEHTRLETMYEAMFGVPYDEEQHED